MEANNQRNAALSRLKEEQEKSLSACLQRIDQWKKFESDYQNLHYFLGTVPNKLSYDVMVPFGKLAFIPGQLINTNNVLVLLGDNWFVERSAKEAQGIVERRIDSCLKTLKELEKEQEQTEQWIKHTELTFGEEGVQEIVEEYDPVKDISWRDKRQRRQGPSKDGQHSVRIERSVSQGHRVRWEDQEGHKPAVISFTHSDRVPPDTLQFQRKEMPETVVSPADIWYAFGSPVTEQKSILKPAKSPQNTEPVAEKIPPRLEENLSNQAFTGTIVEKVSEKTSEVQVENVSRPISRFKARRSKK